MHLSRLVLGVALSLAVVGAAWAKRLALITVKIIGLNDFHGHFQSPGTFSPGPGVPAVPSGGIDVLAGYVATLKRQTPHTVVVSAGDLIGASPLISALFHDEATIETMNQLGLAVHAVGNHEFDEGKNELRRMRHGGCHATDPEHSCKGALVGTSTPFAGATFTFLAANVVDTTTGRTLFPPYSIKRFGRVRVAFIGLTLTDTPKIVIPTGVAGLQFQDEADTINALLPRLRAQGVAAIVVLLHQGGAQTTPPSPSDINACVGGLDGSPIKHIVGRLDNTDSGTTCP